MTYRVGPKLTSRIQHEWTTYQARPAPRAPLEKVTTCSRCYMRAGWPGASDPCQIPPAHPNKHLAPKPVRRAMVQLALGLEGL
jgi:hypothetical protein